MSESTFPLKIEESCDSNEERSVHYFSQGHHEAAVFKEACLAYHRELVGEDAEMEAHLRNEKVEQSYWREEAIPRRDDGVCRYVPCGAHDPGAYPVTYIDVDL